MAIRNKKNQKFKYLWKYFVIFRRGPVFVVGEDACAGTMAS